MVALAYARRGATTVALSATKRLSMNCVRACIYYMCIYDDGGVDCILYLPRVRDYRTENQNTAAVLPANARQPLSCTHTNTRGGGGGSVQRPSRDAPAASRVHHASIYDCARSAAGINGKTARTERRAARALGLYNLVPFRTFVCGTFARACAVAPNCSSATNRTANARRVLACPCAQLLAFAFARARI